MSHFADLEFAGYSVWEMKNVADPFIMELFTKEERQVYTKVEDDEEHTVFEYQSTVRKFIQRLEILGYSLNGAKKSFEAGIEQLHEEMELTDSECKIFCRFDYETWKECMQIIIEHDLSEYNVEKQLPELDIPEHLQPYILFILGKFEFKESGKLPEYYFTGSFVLGFSIFGDQYHESYSLFAEINDMFRAVLDACDPSERVNFDYSDLISWGTYDEEEDITEEPTKVIILTEGSTDREFLERTLNVLYPELSKYYFFLEFHSSNLQGGASSLVHLVKGFVGAGIFNKTIAILDNDTAAIDALRSLRDVPLPDKIRVITLPHLGLAENYPTIGPQGNLNVDINGLTCSIEIYFGVDVLSNAQGELTPIQWTGYNKALQQYNGAIINKRQTQEKYRSLLDRVEKGQIGINECDWSGMKEIFRSIFSAFTIST